MCGFPSGPGTQGREPGRLTTCAPRFSNAARLPPSPTKHHTAGPAAPPHVLTPPSPRRQPRAPRSRIAPEHGVLISPRKQPRPPLFWSSRRGFWRPGGVGGMVGKSWPGLMEACMQRLTCRPRELACWSVILIEQQSLSSEEE